MKIKRRILITLGVLILISIFVAAYIFTTSKQNDKSQKAFPEGYNPDGTRIKEGNENNDTNLKNESNQKINNIQNQNQNAPLTYPGSNVVNSLPSCTNSEVFSVAPLKSEDYSYIEPLGHLNPSSHHIIPSEWLSVNVHRNGSDSVKTNVYAPGDIIVYEIKYNRFYDSSGKFLNEYYSLGFSPCRDIRAWYGDLMLSDNLKKIITNIECAGGSSPINSDLCIYIVNISVKAGELLGTTGGPGSGTAGMIFGVYDSRVNITGFANPARYRPDHLHTACPMNYFTEPAKTMMYGFFGWQSEKRTVEPICGSIMQDVLGTAQGSWFDCPLDNANLENEDKAISLIHDNRLGTLGELVIGSQVSKPGIVEFTTTHTGTINREPSEVTTDGKIYCYQNDDVEKTYLGISGKFILQLIDADTLKIEHREGSCTFSESFVNPFTYKR